MNSIGSNESEGDGSTAQSHQTAVSPSMGEPGNHPAIHPPTHENSEEISTAIDETWDLRSPLMPRLAQGEEQESSSDESNLPLELEEPIEENVAFDPLRVSLMLCAMIMTMLFCGLVTGSFFFPWSDTTFRLQMDTTDSLPFDISVPLYTDAKFSDTLSIFKQSHSNMLVVLMILSTIIAPSFWMLSQVLILYSINGDPQKEVSDTTRTFSRLKRFIGLPLFATKFSMSIVYVNSILLVATSNVRLAIGGDYSPEMQEIKRSKPTNNNGDFIFAEIENVTRGGLVAYVVGTTLGTGAFMLFQHLCCTSSSNDESTAQPQPSAQTGETHVPNNTITNDGDKSILSPPPMAFRISLNYEEIPREDGLVADSSMNESTEEDYRELSTPLMSRMRNNDQPVEEEIAFEMDEPHNDSLHSMDLRAGQRCKFRWRDILEFEAGVLSFLFFFLFADQPLIQLNYSGLLTPVFNELTSESIQLTLIDIIDIVTAKGGKGIFPFVTTSLLWINVILVPLLVWLSCTTALLLKTFSNHDNSRYINLARKCHPLSHITPFALSICVSLGSMNQVSNFLFSENIFCPIVRDLAAVDGSSQCLQISASLKPAAFLLFINTMSIDLYLYLVNST